MTDAQQEFDDLVDDAPPGLTALLNVYEPIEHAYREAVSPVESYAEATNTTSLPRAIVHTSASVR